MRALKMLGGVAVACGAAALWPTSVGRAGESGRSAASDVEPPLVALGRRLFHDPTVSRTGTRSCASCHDPEHGWSDAKTLSDDADGPTRRHSQPVVDLAGDGFHWDGEFRTTTEIVSARLADRDDLMVTNLERLRRRQVAAAANGKRVGFTGGQSQYGGPAMQSGPEAAVTVGERIAREGRYASAFASAFGDDAATSRRVVQAVDAFVRSLKTDKNALDRHLAGDAAALSESARRGLDLFQGRAACSTCHVLDVGADGRAALTDRKYHDTGVAFVNMRPVLTNSRAIEAKVQLARGRGMDDGRGAETFADSDVGAFKTPSLRDVARRAPYMHDGSLATLKDVVGYYSKGGTPNDHLDPAMKKLDLTAAESADLVAFLESLTGDARPGKLPARTKEKRIWATVVDIEGRAMPDLDVEVVPCGETLGDAASASASASASVTTKTSKDGLIKFAFPQTTHVMLLARGVQLAGGRPIPDVAGDVRVVAARTDRVYVYFRRRGMDMPERLVGGTAGGTKTMMLGSDGSVIDLDVQIEAASEVTPAAPPRVPETFLFERIGEPGPDGALYAAPVGAARGSTFLKFRLSDGLNVAAAVDLSGGDAGPAWLANVTHGSIRRR